MKKLFSLPLIKRKIVCVILGIAFGFLCSFLAWKSSPDLQNDPNYWWSPMMWAIVYNRFLIGVVILFAGAFTVHPFFKWLKFAPWFRGTILGAVVSVDMAIGSLISGTPDSCKIFWMTILAGAIYGLIIDVVATKIAGEGKDLLKTV